ncbi:MAG: 1,4-alpha-glucan branching protein GlgB [Syntrophorhabdaceae bacterium]|nr:1,4-alpha-glucan branching protein GlgB [Syntrophorhabdaceae bacterium]
MKPSVHKNDLDLLAAARHWDPFSVLGPHVVDGTGDSFVSVRVIQPRAKRVTLIREDQKTGNRIPMTSIHPVGIFEAQFPGETIIFPYLLKFEGHDGYQWTQHDPYAFGLVLSDFDIHLLTEGTHLNQYNKLGSHVVTHGGIAGTAFAVWAPNAERVSVVCNANHWDGRVYPMRIRGESGIWEIFLPGIGDDEVYKYEVRSRGSNEILLKTDPFAFRCEKPPRTGSIVCSIDRHTWNDETWMNERASRNILESPFCAYEVHLGSWKRKEGEGGPYLSYKELADDLIPYVREMGYTHIELLPVMEHPFDGSWGYQVLGYFAPTSRFGRPKEFMEFVDRCHQEGIGVILDWVPAHFPRDAHGLGRFDGTHLYEHADPRMGEHRDWGTLIFNFGRREVANFLLSNALFWMDKYHVDGLRVDAVASMLYLDYSRKPGEWVPNKFGGRENLEAIAFIKRLNEEVHARYPGTIVIAEESTAWPGVSRPVYLGGLGFTMKWNMGWMHDTLAFMEQDPVYRKFHFGQLTFALLYAFHENFVLPFSHDEVVHLKRSMLGKMPGDLWQKFANLRLLYSYMYAHPGKKMLFMGGEIAQWEEWDHDSSLDWHLLQWDKHHGMRKFVRDLNHVYRATPAFFEQDFSHKGFEWIDFRDMDNSVVSLLRLAKDPRDCALCVFNFTPVPREGYRIGVPYDGRYLEVLNSDAAVYGGSNVGNSAAVNAQEISWMGRPYSIHLTLPPLGALFFLPEREAPRNKP